VLFSKEKARCVIMIQIGLSTRPSRSTPTGFAAWWMAAKESPRTKFSIAITARWCRRWARSGPVNGMTGDRVSDGSTFVACMQSIECCSNVWVDASATTRSLTRLRDRGGNQQLLKQKGTIMSSNISEHKKRTLSNSVLGADCMYETEDGHLMVPCV